MRRYSLLAPALAAAAAVCAAVGGTRPVAAWGVQTTVWGGSRRWTSISASGRKRARAASSPPLRSSLTDVDLGVEEGLGEGEELLGTVDVSPEEIADFFAQPT